MPLGMATHKHPNLQNQADRIGYGLAKAERQLGQAINRLSQAVQDIDHLQAVIADFEHRLRKLEGRA